MSSKGAPAGVLFLLGLLLVGLDGSAHAQARCETVVEIDFAAATNPNAAQWTDLFGSPTTNAPLTNAGSATFVPFHSTDQNQGALPGGSVHFRNVGTGVNNNGQGFDLLITVASMITTYTANPTTVDLAYISPSSTSATQAILTQAGFACLGVGVNTATCASGSTALSVATVTCTDGTQTVQKAAEFDFWRFQVGGFNLCPMHVRDPQDSTGTTTKSVTPAAAFESSVTQFSRPRRPQHSLATSSIEPPQPPPPLGIIAGLLALPFGSFSRDGADNASHTQAIVAIGIITSNRTLRRLWKRSDGASVWCGASTIDCCAYTDVPQASTRSIGPIKLVGTGAYMRAQFRGPSVKHCCHRGTGDSPPVHMRLVCGGRRRDTLQAQFRFIPALRHLKQRVVQQPSVKWLGLVDDDSIVNPILLLRLLSALDSTQKLQLGELDPSRTRCGGSGSLFSRTAAMRMKLRQCALIFAGECGQSDWFLSRCAEMAGVNEVPQMSCRLCGTSCSAMQDASLARVLAGNCSFAQVTHICHDWPATLYRQLLSFLVQRKIPIAHIDSGIPSTPGLISQLGSAEAVPRAPHGFKAVGPGCCRAMGYKPPHSSGSGIQPWDAQPTSTTLSALLVSHSMSLGECAADCHQRGGCDAFEFNALQSCAFYTSTCSGRCWHFRTGSKRRGELQERRGELQAACGEFHPVRLQFCYHLDQDGGEGSSSDADGTGGGRGVGGGVDLRRSSGQDDAEPGRVCVATVITAERIPSLHRLAQSWSGELSVAYLMADFERVAHAPSLQLLATSDGTLPAAPFRVSLSLVQDVGYLRPRDRFPTNLLRNIATDGCSAAADVVLMLDVDFQLCCGSAEGITTALERHAHAVRRAGGTLGTVIPVFEGKPGVAGPRIPESKEQLVALLERGLVQPFQHDVFPSAHRCDAWDRWKGAPLVAPTLPTAYQMNCEPYLLYSRWLAPRYDPRFVGYGKNRASFHYEQAARGLKMRVLPDLFIFHQQDDGMGANRLRQKNWSWMVGESCWAGFVQRVEHEYGFSLPKDSAQGWIDAFMAANLSLSPALRHLPGSTGVVCASEQDHVCVPPHCSPKIVRLKSSPLPNGAEPRVAEISLASLAGKHRSSALLGANFSVIRDTDKLVMASREAEEWFSLLLPATSYLEWGTGGTTVLAAWRAVHAQQPNLRIHAIDSRKDWIHTLRSHPVVAQAEAARKLVLYHGNIGDTSTWGRPQNWTQRSLDVRRSQALSYVRAGNASCCFDVILVDGRFRKACAFHALQLANPRTVVLVHDSERYLDDQFFRQHYSLISRVGTLAVMRPKRHSLDSMQHRAPPPAYHRWLDDFM